MAAAFFIWRDYRREDRLSKRIDLLEDEQRKVLLPLAEKCAGIIAANTEVMQRLEHHFDR